MDQTKKTLLATAAVITCLGAGVTGFMTRASVDMGAVAPNQLSLIASNEKTSQFAEGQYFYEVTELLRREYVEPVKVDQKMTSGAVRGMIGRLRDPDSQYMNEEQFKSYLANQKGVFEGIGVEVRNEFNPEELKRIQSGEDPTDALLLLPEVYVSAVLPGSPASRVGIKVGDRVESIDKKSLVTYRDVTKLREMQNMVTNKKASAAELNLLRDELQKKIESNLPPAKVREHLMLGEAGTVALVVTRDNKPMSFSVTKGKSVLEPVIDSDTRVFQTQMISGVGEKLKSIGLKAGDTIDLRNSTLGNSLAIFEVLEQIVPAGRYGQVIRSGGVVTRPIVTTRGTPEIIPINVLVDKSTQGAAMILASILKSIDGISVDGTLVGDPKWLDTVALGDGSGYTLYTGDYSATLPTATALRGEK